VRAYRKATGFSVGWLQMDRRARRWIIALALVILALFLAGVALHAVWGWVGPVLAGIVTVPVVIIVGRRYDAAVRADVRRHA
jgi:CHASE2 domain-containing sensor protein